MFIFIIGPSASGKNTVAEFLQSKYSFTRLRLNGPTGLMAASRMSTNQLDVGKLTLSDETPPATPSLEETSPERTWFKTPEEMLAYTTERWREPFMTTDPIDSKALEDFKKRPWTMVVHVDAPRIERWKRSNAKRTADQDQSLEDFIREDDKLIFGTGQTAPTNPPSGVLPEQPLLTDYTLAAKLAKLSIYNIHDTVEQFHTHLSGLRMTDGDRLRPSWDTYFMTLADYAASRSNCMKRSVGCVIAQDKWFVSAGYNGTPKKMVNCNDGGCPRCNSGAPGGTGLNTCFCIHAEENALLGANKEKTTGATLYCNTCPCTTCSVKIVQAGIVEVVYSQSYALGAETEGVFKSAGVNLRQYTPPP